MWNESAAAGDESFKSSRLKGMEAHISGRGVQFMTGERGWGSERGRGRVFNVSTSINGSSSWSSIRRDSRSLNTGLPLPHNAIPCSIVFYTHLQSHEGLDLWIFTQVPLKAARDTQLVTARVNEQLNGWWINKWRSKTGDELAQRWLCKPKHIFHSRASWKSTSTAKSNSISILSTQCKMQLARNKQARTYFLTPNYLYITIMRFITILVSLTCDPFFVAYGERQRPFFFSDIAKKDSTILQARITVTHHMWWMCLNFPA